jgi:hypothetical protein
MTRSELHDDSASFQCLQIRPETAEKRQLNHGRNAYSEYPYSHGFGQLAVFVAFHGGSGCENLVYLFIFKHLCVHAIKLNEDIVKQLKGVSTLC